MRLDFKRLVLALVVLVGGLAALFLVETDTGRVKKLVERGRGAVVRGDADACLALFTPDYEYRGQDRAALRAWIAQSFKEYRFSDVRILKRVSSFPAPYVCVTELTALLCPASDSQFPNPIRIEVRLQLRKRSGAWLIDRLESLRGER